MTAGQACDTGIEEDRDLFLEAHIFRVSMTNQAKLPDKLHEGMGMHTKLTTDAFWMPVQQLLHPSRTREDGRVVGFLGEY